MKLLKTSFYSAIIAFIRIASGLVAGKVVAIFTGPAGVALIGAFTNFIAIVFTFANGAVNTGVIKYTAEYEGDEPKLKSLFSTAFKISLYCSSITGLLLFTLATYFSQWIFTVEIYAKPIKVLGLSIILYTLNSLLLSILNGKGQIKSFTIINATGSLIGLMFTLILVYLFELEGALYALVLAQSVVFFVTGFFVIKSNWFSLEYFNQAFDKVIAMKLSHYSLMAIVSALTVPVSQIFLRNIVITNLGVDSAGYWQGMMRISDGYLMIVTSSLGTYYLPKLSSLKKDYEVRIEVLKTAKIILPLVVVGCVVIYFSRFLIISVLYTKKFYVIESLFFWQLVGDVFKVASWLLAYIMVAKAMTKYFLITEIVFSISYVLFGWLFVKWFDIRGITMAFALNYLLCFCFMIYLFRKMLFSGKIKPEIS